MGRLRVPCFRLGVSKLREGVSADRIGSLDVLVAPRPRHNLLRDRHRIGEDYGYWQCTL